MDGDNKAHSLWTPLFLHAYVGATKSCPELFVMANRFKRSLNYMYRNSASLITVPHCNPVLDKEVTARQVLTYPSTS